MNFKRHCLIKKNISIAKNVRTLYISYALGPQLRTLKTDFTLGNGLFWSVKLTKNAELQSVTKYKRLTLVFMWNSGLQEKFYCYY